MNKQSTDQKVKQLQATIREGVADVARIIKGRDVFIPSGKYKNQPARITDVRISDSGTVLCEARVYGGLVDSNDVESRIYWSYEQLLFI
jgi:hypothetical protein